MRKTIITLCAFAVWAASGLAVEQPETSKLEFVTEYISGLAALENIRESGETGVQTSGGRCSLHQLQFSSSRRGHLIGLRDV